jgi:hypothetical protein
MICGILIKLVVRDQSLKVSFRLPKRKSWVTLTRILCGDF